jgi:nucleoside-diphosphate-sugar epimerase
VAAALPTRIVAVPTFLLRVLGWVGDLGEFVLRRSLPVSSYSVDRLTRSFVIDGRRFRLDTGWRPPVSGAEAIRRTVSNLVERGQECRL